MESFEAGAIWVEAKQVSSTLFGSSSTSGINDAEDAFRHAYASYMSAAFFGNSEAKALGDAHERSAVNRWGERIMDLYNNHVGRMLAADPSNHQRDPAVVIMDALIQGKLLLQPPNVGGNPRPGPNGSYYATIPPK